MPPDPAPALASSPARPAARGEWLAVAALTLLAAALRFPLLESVPPGFHFDEAYEAVEALRVLQQPDYRPIFFTGNFGVEPVFIYLTALAFRLFGASPLAMRAVAALAGSLTVPALYLLGRAMRRADPTLPRFFPLAAAAALAGLFWHLFYSRVGIEPVLVPLFATLTFACFWWGVADGGWGPWLGAGVCLALCTYAYPAGRMAPLLFAAAAAWGLLCAWGPWRKRLGGLLLVGLAAAALLAPLAWFFYQQPDLLTLRASQVAVAGQETGSLGDNILRTLGMFSLRGDPDPRNNLPGRPVLDLFLALPFYGGLLLALRWVRRPVWGSLLLWLGVMLLPTALTEYPPHFRRAIGAAPAVAMLAGLGAAAALDAVRPLAAGRRAQSGPALWWGACLLVLALWGGSVAQAARDYFVAWGQSPAVFYAYDEGLWALGQRLRGLDGERVYLSPRSPEHYTLGFALWGQPTLPRAFDGRHGLVLPRASAEGDAWYAVVTHEDWRFPLLLEPFLPGARLEEQILDGEGRVYAQVWRLPAGQGVDPAPTPAMEVRFGEALVLRGYSVEPKLPEPGKSLYLTLYWQALAPVAQDYTVFTHLLGPHNPASGGPVWAGHDGQPLGGSYPTSRWATDEWIVDQHEWQVPADTPRGSYDIEVGLYRLETGERLPVQVAGRQVGDHVVLGRLAVAPPCPSCRE
ncbi:MAG: hypothetical protein GX605_11415 [Chloroflexi bacterium]|nr:hypothetical protein [Chloroflexota bacterium]